MSSLQDERAYEAWREKVNPRLRDERWERTHTTGVRLMTPFGIGEVQAKYARGEKVDHLAAYYGVSRRTIYRYLKGTILWATIGGWTAMFRLRPDHEPVRIGKWRAL